MLEEIGEETQRKDRDEKERKLLEVLGSEYEEDKTLIVYNKKIAVEVVSYQDYEKVVEQLVGGADMNGQDIYDETPLHTALVSGYEKVLELLLAAGVDINTQNGSFGTTLHTASAKGHEKMVEQLLAAGANVNAHGGTYNTALQAVSYGGYEKAVDRLITAGADVNTQGGWYGTALYAAFRKGTRKWWSGRKQCA